MQNVYDDDNFFARYSELPRSVSGLDGAPEWPRVRALLGDLAGRDILDLGCGLGAFCRYARANGARRIVGVDLSEKMLARAIGAGGARIVYERASIEDYAAAPTTFDLVYSALALHYVAGFADICRRVATWLRRGGDFVFTVEHPIFTALPGQSWIVENGVRLHWPVDRYLDEGERATSWLAEGVIKQHRTIATTVNALIGAGLIVRALIEWGPTPAQIAREPSWADEARRPMFLIVSARAP
jgi:SAM-dependent methyltransferase